MVSDRGLSQCVPNFSEGRRQEVIQAVVEAFEKHPGSRLLDYKSDTAHNRTVVTLVGSPAALVESALAGTREAVRLIDMREHKGGHPRLGAMDVIPFIPLGGSSMEDCILASRALGQAIASELDLPVFLYEASASSRARRNLAFIRKGEYEGLGQSMKTQGREPDMGPSRPHPTAGAVVIGARQPLVAYNVNLATTDLGLAKRIADGVRARGGGYAFCKAMGLETADASAVQVSMNLTDFTKTPIHRVFEHIKSEAARYGVAVLESEIVGLVPAEALVASARHYLQLNHLDQSQILEHRLLEEAF